MVAPAISVLLRLCGLLHWLFAPPLPAVTTNLPRQQMPAPTASEQVNADYEAALQEFAMFKSDPKKMFCLGATMAVLSMQGYAREPKMWPRGATTVEDAIEKYYEAARGKILNG